MKNKADNFHKGEELTIDKQTNIEKYKVTTNSIFNKI